MKIYTVEIEISLANEVITTYISVEANSQKEAHKAALKKVDDTLEIKAETNPPEALENNIFGDTSDIFGNTFDIYSHTSK